MDYDRAEEIKRQAYARAVELMLNNTNRSNLITTHRALMYLKAEENKRRTHEAIREYAKKKRRNNQ